MPFTEQDLLLLFVNVACTAWLAARLWRRCAKPAGGPGSAGTGAQAQPGQRWRTAAAAWIAAALAGHLGRLVLRATAADAAAGRDAVPDGLSCLLASLLLVRRGCATQGGMLGPAAATGQGLRFQAKPHPSPLRLSRCRHCS